MIAAGASFGSGRNATRPSVFVVVAAAHLLAIWLLLQRGPFPEPPAAEPLLALFDVVPPALPQPPPPEPPAVREPAPRTGAPTTGGSPGTRRERAAKRTDLIAPPAREAMDATLTPMAASAPPLPAAGTALVDLGAGGTGGTGTGSGSGSGDGAGDGNRGGNGGGDEDAFARAEWVSRPTAEVYQRYWPWGKTLPKHAVTVTLKCYVRRDGSPFRCRHLSEYPRNSGFAQMVYRAILDSKVRPVARNGSPVWNLPVRITIELNRLAVAPPVTAAASAPPVPAQP